MSTQVYACLRCYVRHRAGNRKTTVTPLLGKPCNEQDVITAEHPSPLSFRRCLPIPLRLQKPCRARGRKKCLPVEQAEIAALKRAQVDRISWARACCTEVEAKLGGEGRRGDGEGEESCAGRGNQMSLSAARAGGPSPSLGIAPASLTQVA